MGVSEKIKFILRPLRVSDAESITKHGNEKDIAKGMLYMPNPLYLSYVKLWLERAVRDNRKAMPTQYRLAIDVGGEAVGVVSLYVQRAEWAKHSAEIKYWLGKKYWGGGIMTQAVRELTRIGFEKFKLKRIFGAVYSHNKSSMRVLEKCGYKFEGIMKKEVHKQGKLLDTHVYARTK
jgi:[ribosomal protein S5]-alanine N-acetyltransferase